MSGVRRVPPTAGCGLAVRVVDSGMRFGIDVGKIAWTDIAATVRVIHEQPKIWPPQSRDRESDRGALYMPVITAGTLPTGTLRGADHGVAISLILDHSKPGHGPRLHRHPYDETWVVIEGELTFQLDEEQLEINAGDIVIAPLGVPHKFTNRGPARSHMICIHANPTMITEWLE